MVFDETWSMKWHEKYTVENQLDNISDRFKLTKNQKDYIKNLIENHHNFNNDEEYLKELGIFYEQILIRLADLMWTQSEKLDPKDLEERKK